MGFEDPFFEKKLFQLIGFETETDSQISDNNLLDLHLSHRTVKIFNYVYIKKHMQSI